MSNFPLYDTLLTDISSGDLLSKQKDELIKLIKSLDTEGVERIYIIIRIYQLENNNDKNMYTLPYGGKYVKSMCKFDLDVLPLQLKHMLYKFVKIHKKTMDENLHIQAMAHDMTTS